ncbi:MAG: pilus assembly protein, partial [Anaerolineales bacterium]|nr:pilus assembly protein [Anaerolineales bacterium]
MKPIPKLHRRYRGQTLVEFALVVPIMLLVLFAIIEIARLLFAWVSIENGARFGVRYAVTGEFDDTKCSIFPGGICDTQTERDAARIPSIHDAALSGAAAIWRDPAAVDGQKGFLK